MKRSKKIFVGVMLAFFAGLILLAYDISRKTTFPGSRSHLKDSLKLKRDKSEDSLKSISSPKSPIHQP